VRTSQEAAIDAKRNIAMSDRLLELEVFLRVAETESFSRSARDLGLSQPAVSRIVASLEKRLDASLVARSTRRVTLTRAGASFADYARDALFALEQGRSCLETLHGLYGSLRIAMPATFGARVVVPILGPFLDAHPQLRVDLKMSDQACDLLAESIDIALRIGMPTHASFPVRELASAPRMLVASPGFFRTHKAPSTLGDLSTMPCITGPSDSHESVWKLTGPDDRLHAVPVGSRLHATSVEGIVACAVAGYGIAPVSRWAAQSELAAGKLVMCLEPYRLSPVHVHAVFPSGRRTSANARAFADFMAEQLRLLDEEPDQQCAA
jgi:DNA-binding transcriptional LysR family regulator